MSELPEICWLQLQHPKLEMTKTELWVCQLATTVPNISGNKWLKLASALRKRSAKQGILSMGGAFSNHLAALAAAGKHYGFPTVGLVRTDKIDLTNPTLAQCLQNGMYLQPVDRSYYRQRHTSEFNQKLINCYPDYLIIPEGGSNEEGAKGVMALPLAQTPAGEASLLCCATASGGTIAGIIQRYPDIRVLGLAVVQDKTLIDKVNACLPINHNFSNWELTKASSAYGKVKAEVVAFCCELKPQISLEPIYTGKALYQLFELLEKKELAAGQRIAFFHTGGLQGLAGLYYRKLISETEYALLAADDNEEACTAV